MWTHIVVYYSGSFSLPWRFTLSFNLHLLGALHSVSGLAIWFMGSGGQFNEQTEVLTVVWWYFLLAFTH